MTMSLREFSRKGGRSRSAAKLAAARENIAKATAARKRKLRSKGARIKAA